MSTQTAVMLSTDSSTITTPANLHFPRCIILGIGNMQPIAEHVTHSVSTLLEHVSIRFFSIANRSWRGAARHANDTGSCRTPCVRRAAPANRSFEGNPRYARTPLRSALGMKDARFAASFTARVPLNSRCR